MEVSKLLNSIERIQNIIVDLENEELQEEIEQLSSKIRNEKFYLVVLGLFKRGKSSFINSLLGKEVAPTAVVPLTSVITLIEYGEKDYAKILFHDKTESIIDISQVDEYIAEEKNPHNKKNVELVTLFINSDILKTISIIDTPGVGSTLEHNTKTTYAFIEKIDAAVFIFSADIPITEIEAEFLKKLYQSVPKIIFVLNKKDIISQKDLDSILNFNRNVLKSICGEDEAKIFLLSAKQAIEGHKKQDRRLIEESGIQNIIDEINSLLKNDKTEILSKSSLNRFNSILNQVNLFLEVQLQTLKTPIDKLQQQYSEFENSLKTMYESKDDFDILILGKVKQLQDYVTETIYDYGKKLYNSIEQKVSINIYDYLEEIKKNGIIELQEQLFNYIEKSFDPLKEKLENEVIEKFQNILKDYSKGSNRFINELVKNLSELGTIHFEELISTFNLQIATCFYYSFQTAKLPSIFRYRFIRKITPNNFLAKVILNLLKENIMRNIDMNCGRINYDIRYKIQESFREFKYTLNKEIENIINLMRQIIKKTIEQKLYAEKEVENNIKNLTEKLKNLLLIKEEVDSVDSHIYSH